MKKSLKSKVNIEPQCLDVQHHCSTVTLANSTELKADKIGRTQNNSLNQAQWAQFEY